MWRPAFAALCCIVICAPCLADSLISASALYRRCAEPDGNVECASYIAGVIDGFFVGTFIFSKDKAADYQHVCIPPDATHRTLAETVIAFMRVNPKAQDLGGGAVVFAALRDAFPCR